MVNLEIGAVILAIFSIFLKTVLVILGPWKFPHKISIFI